MSVKPFLSLISITTPLALAATAQAVPYTDFASFDAAVDVLGTIDFENLPAGTLVSNQYNNAFAPDVGVLFQGLDGGTVDIANAADISGQTGGAAQSGSQALDIFGSDTDPIQATIVIPGTSTPTSIDAVGAWMIDINTFAPGQAQFFDISGMLLGTVTNTSTTGADANVFIGFSDPRGISRIVFDGVSTSEFVLIDDFSVGRIPEPATLSALGVVGLLLRRRR